jgi:hypothetical protein
LLSFGHQALAKVVLAVEHFPYASRQYGGRMTRLPLRARDYNFGLVKSAMERKAVVVLMRGHRRWLRDLPSLADYEGLCLLQNPQMASISRGNCERFEEVFQAVKAASAPIADMASAVNCGTADGDRNF